MIGTETRTIVAITDADHATVDAAWAQDSTDSASFSYQKSAFAVSDSAGDPIMHIDTAGVLQLSRGDISTAPGTTSDLTMTSVAGDVNINSATGEVALDGGAGVQLKVDGTTTLEVAADGTFVRNGRFHVADPDDGSRNTLEVDSNGAVTVAASSG